MHSHIHFTQLRTLQLLDQRVLPGEVRHVECRSAADVTQAIRDMVVRGAPAIGITAAYGMALAAVQASGAPTKQAFIKSLKAEAVKLKAARPTAVNLEWAVELLLRLAVDLCQSGAEPEDVADAMLEEAVRIHQEDIASCKSIGRHGLAFVPAGTTILTHCNAGALATGGYGTALGIVRAAHEASLLKGVLADETRPFLQGARLTAWELKEDGIPVTLVCDGMAGALMAQGKVGLVVVGADRIAANGDTANKVGTYALAVLAKHHGIPFIVAAPRSTFDPNTKDGQAIPIEERSADEVLCLAGRRLAPEGVSALHPAFDVTPHDLIRAIVTEDGVIEPVDEETVGHFLAKGVA